MAAGLEVLLTGIRRLGWPLIWIDNAHFEAMHWQRLIAEAQACGFQTHTRESFRVPTIEIDHDWPGYERRLTRNLRRQIKRMVQRAKETGDVKLTVYRDASPEEIEPLLRRGFAVEDSGWKGSAGTSVLKWPERFAFHLQEATEVAKFGALQLSFLETADRPIAFEYGWNCKGVYHSFKVGYDEAFAELTPGQCLRHRLLRAVFQRPRTADGRFYRPRSRGHRPLVDGNVPSRPARPQHRLSNRASRSPRIPFLVAVDPATAAPSKRSDAQRSCKSCLKSWGASSAAQMHQSWQRNRCAVRT